MTADATERHRLAREPSETSQKFLKAAMLALCSDEFESLALQMMISTGSSGMRQYEPGQWLMVRVDQTDATRPAPPPRPPPPPPPTHPRVVDDDVAGDVADTPPPRELSISELATSEQRLEGMWVDVEVVPHEGDDAIDGVHALRVASSPLHAPLHAPPPSGRDSSPVGHLHAISHAISSRGLEPPPHTILTMALHPWNHVPRQLPRGPFEAMLHWWCLTLRAKHSHITDPLSGHQLDTSEQPIPITMEAMPHVTDAVSAAMWLRDAHLQVPALSPHPSPEP